MGKNAYKVSNDFGATFAAKTIPGTSAVWKVEGLKNSLVALARYPQLSVFEMLTISIDGGANWKSVPVRGGTEIANAYYIYNGKIYVSSNLNGSQTQPLIYISN